MKTHPLDFLLSGFFTTLLVCFSIIPIILLSTITKKLLGEYHVVFNPLLFLLLYGIWSAITLRLMLIIKPFQAGTYKMTTPLFTYWKLFTVIKEFGKGALLPFTTLFTKPLITKLFGAKIGNDIALGGHLVDSQLIDIGNEVIIGQDSVITAHTINSGSITLAPVKIADRVTIGVHAVLMSGVTVGTNSVITAGSVVTPNTQIPPKEMWGGVPAKKIKSL